MSFRPNTRKRKSAKPTPTRKKQKKNNLKIQINYTTDLNDPVATPISINTIVHSRWKVDNKLYACRVLDKKLDKATGQWLYYLHYNNLDRRNEVWKSRDEIELNPNLEQVVTPVPQTAIAHAHENIQQMKQYKKNVDAMVLGDHKIECWYWSPIPKEFEKTRVLHFCDFCLNFFGNKSELHRHQRICTLRHPPGNEIYRSKERFGTVVVFEVDGEKEWIYCQNVCYIAKLFLDHKTLLYDTNIFLFYIVCEVDDRGAHFVGYFSKDKYSTTNNLACILTLPPYQKKGYGRFLISLSYELSKIEGRAGTPERPLSDLGCVSYQRYWARAILDVIEQNGWHPISLRKLKEQTYIIISDIKETLENLSLVHYIQGEHVITLSEEICKQIRGRKKKDDYRVRPCDPERIRWRPFIKKDTAESLTDSP